MSDRSEDSNFIFQRASRVPPLKSKASLHTTVKFGLEDINKYDFNTIFNIRYTQNLKSGRVDYYVCESFINCPKTVQVKFKDGFYEIYLCVSHNHNHEINAFKKRRKLLENFIETESQSRDFK